MESVGRYGEPPAVSVVVPVRDEVATIGATLASITTQSFSDLEILVVDGMSGDGTVEVVLGWAERDSRIRLVDNPGQTIPRALNRALDRARGRWLVRVDAHSSIDRTYVERLVTILEQGWGGAGGRKRAVGGPPSGPAISAVLSSPFGVGGSRYHYTDEPGPADHVPFGAYPVALARRLGGWDPRLVANEDFEFDVRLRKAGAELFLDPSVVVDWQCRDRIWDLARQYQRYGRGKADVALLHPDELRLRHLLPPGLVAGLCLTALSAPTDRRPAIALLVAYGGGLAALSVPIGRRLSEMSQRIRVPAALAAMQLGWGFGFWRGLVRLLLNGWRLPDVDEEAAQRWDSPDWSRKNLASDSGQQERDRPRRDEEVAPYPARLA